MARPKLTAAKRTQLGRKTKKLRDEGILPANVYGTNVKSVSIQLKLADFSPVYREVGETGLIDLSIEKEKEIRPVLIHNVQTHPVSDQIIHADFRQVDLMQKVRAPIPVELVGEAPAIEQKLGILVRLVDEIEVEALPTDLPEKIEVDVSGLVKVCDMVKAGELKLGETVTMEMETDEPVVKIEPPVKEEVEEKPAEEVEAEGEGEAVIEGEGEAASGEVPVEDGAEPPAKEA